MRARRAFHRYRVGAKLLYRWRVGGHLDSGALGAWVVRGVCSFRAS